MGVNVVPREEWRAWDAWSRTPRHPPADTVLWSYTGSDVCTTKAKCMEYMLELQRTNLHQDKLEDIRYNFVVGGDGDVYEGRGWLLSPQLPVEGLKHNRGINLYIGVCGPAPAGDSGAEIPDLEPFKELLEFGVKCQLIMSKYNRVRL